ncbi:MAG: hypothetical protein IKL81_00960 [Clostridia bacterium]|nr:hypothetical protein [Clostridia bacterium]
MALRSGLFDSTEIIESASGYPRGNRAENAEFFARYFSRFVGNGVYASPSDGFLVKAGDGLNVKIMPGDAFINGYFAFCTEEQIISLFSGVEETVYRIVLRMNRILGCISLEVLDDNIALTRNENIYELALADVRVGASASYIMQSDIVDLRFDSELCGMVTALIDQLDTSAFAEQLDAVIADSADAYASQLDFIASAEQEFCLWIDSLHERIGEDGIVNLAQNKAERDLSNVLDGSILSRHLSDEVLSQMGGVSMIFKGNMYSFAVI